MQRGADKLRARCFMKQHASRDARVPGSLAAQPRPASVAPSAGRDRAARVDPWPSGPDATRALGRTPQRPECRALGCATYMGAPLTGRRFLSYPQMTKDISAMAFWKAAGPHYEGESYRSTDLPISAEVMTYGKLMLIYGYSHVSNNDGCQSSG